MEIGILINSILLFVIVVLLAMIGNTLDKILFRLSKPNS